MIRTKKDKFFIFEVLTMVLMLVICIGLVKLQIVDNDKYLKQSKSKLSTSEVISAPRGKILDRYGRPIVTNRLGFSVSFTDASLSDDELNDLILNTVKLFNKNEDEYIDTLYIGGGTPSCLNNNQLKSETVDLIIYFCVAQKRISQVLLNLVFSTEGFYFFFLILFLNFT